MLALDITPPATRYWTVTVENIWHECIEPPAAAARDNARQRRPPERDGHGARWSSAATDPGVPNWLDTGGRHRGLRDAPLARQPRRARRRGPRPGRLPGERVSGCPVSG